MMVNMKESLKGSVSEFVGLGNSQKALSSIPRKTCTDVTLNITPVIIHVVCLRICVTRRLLAL